MKTTQHSLFTLLALASLTGCDSPDGIIINQGPDNGIIVQGEPDDGIIIHDEPDNGIITNDETDNAAALGLLVRVEVQPGELLEIYEPTPGTIVVSGSGAPVGPPSVVPQALQGLTLAEVWEHHGGGEPMPAALADAARRMGDAPLAGERSFAAAVQWDADYQAPAIDTLTDRPDVAASGFCDAGFFGMPESDCDNYPFDNDVTVCLDNWYNGAWAKANDSGWTDSTVCAAQGSVVMRLTGTNVQGLWTVPQNTYRNVTVFTRCHQMFTVCPDNRIDIEQASGDRFHFRFLAEVG